MSPDLRARLASLAGGEWRGAPHIFDRLSTAFCKKKWGKIKNGISRSLILQGLEIPRVYILLKEDAQRILFLLEIRLTRTFELE